jgi:glutaredoxin-like protein
MGMIRDRDKAKVRERLAGMTNPVRVLLFTSGKDCLYCPETKELLQDLAALHDRIEVEEHDLEAEAELAATYGVDQAPALVLVGDRDRGIRFLGIPAGYEFATLLEDLVMVSTGDPGLSPATQEKLRTLDRDVHLQVFVTPTCPYCPGAVRLAHRLALASDRITADMVEATEFPHLADRFDVVGVPKTVANGEAAAEGAVPEADLVERILAIAG